jgi:hypothetical protein
MLRRLLAPHDDEGRCDNSSGLSFLPGGVHNCADTQTSRKPGFTGYRIPINLDRVAEIAQPQMYGAHNVNTKPEGDNPCSLETFPGNELSLNRSSGC